MRAPRPHRLAVQPAGALFAVLVSSAMLAPPAFADSPMTVWGTPFGAVEEWIGYHPGPILTLGQVPGLPSLRVTASQSDVVGIIHIPFDLPEDFLIETVTVCYRVSDSRSTITQWRLLETTTPDGALIRYNNSGNSNSITARCETESFVEVCGDCLSMTPNGAVSMALTLYFYFDSHWIDIGGVALHGHWLTVDAPGGTRPATIALAQNEPNPFREDTRIRYTLSESGTVRIRIFDVSGRRIQSFDLGVMPAGTHSLQWNGLDRDGQAVSPGTYFYQARLGDEEITRRLTIRR